MLHRPGHLLHDDVDDIKAHISHIILSFKSPSEANSVTKNERKKIKDIQETITDDTEIDENFCMSLEQVPSAMGYTVSSFSHAEESDSVVQQESSLPTRQVRAKTPLDPQLLARILQGLRDSLSSKRIANVSEQLRAFYYGSAIDTSAAFWRAGPVYGFTMNSSASFNDCIFGHDGRGHVLRHDQISRLSFPPTETVLGMLRNGNFHSMTRSAPATASPTSSALLHVKSPFTVPPIWVDVVQAIMRAMHIAPATVTPVITPDNKRPGSHDFSDSLFIESLIGSKDTIPMANDSASSNIKRPREESPFPEISPKRPKELFVEEAHQKEKRKSRHGERSGDDKIDRRERKRRKKEKQRARKERKRRAHVHDAPLEDTDSAHHESSRQENVSQPNDPVHRFAAMSLQADQVDDSFEQSDVNAPSDTMRQKIQHLRLGGKTAVDAKVLSSIDQRSNQMQANPVSAHYSDAVSPADVPAFVDQQTTAGERKPETDRAILDAVRPALGPIGIVDTKRNGSKAKKKHKKTEKKVRSTSKSSHVAGKKENSAPEIYIALLPRAPASVREEADASEGAMHLVRPTDRQTFHLTSKNATPMHTEGKTGNPVSTRAEPPDISSVASHDTENSAPVAAKLVSVSNDCRSDAQLHSEASAWTSEAVPVHQDGRNSSPLENNGPPFRAICSETFLEDWNEATTLLASGEWLPSCQPLVTNEARVTNADEPPRLGQKIQLFDTPLLDDAGVDIELPGHAIIVYRLSSWQTSESANVHAKGLARLTALGRYERLDVIFCADVDISPALSLAIAFVQNSVVHQSRTQCRPPTFQVIAPRLLAAVVASRILSSQGPAAATDSFVNGSMTDARVQERARFLLSICPLLTVCGALECLNLRLSGAPHDDDEWGQSFQHLMTHTAMTTCVRPIWNGKLVATNPSAFEQLKFAINVSSNNLLS